MSGSQIDRSLLLEIRPVNTLHLTTLGGLRIEREGEKIRDLPA